MKIYIGDPEKPLAERSEYQLTAYSEMVTLADLIVLRRDTGLLSSDIDAAMEHVDPKNLERARLDPPEFVVDEEQQILAFGIVVWLTRRRAGERLNLEDACDFPMSWLEMVPDPGDATPDPIGARTRSTGQGSGRPPQDRKRRKAPSKAGSIPV